jgi:hypothetical protein
VSLPYLLGSRVLRLAGERLRPFQEIYYTAGFSEVYEAYLGKWLMAYILATPLVASLSLALHQSLGFPLPVSVVLTLIVLFAYSLVFLAACLYYPVYRRHSRGWTITARLPYTLAYFAVLASSGLGFTEILRMVRELEENKEIRREVDLLLTDVELLGVDVLSALERAAARSPSAALSLFLSGVERRLPDGWEPLQLHFLHYAETAGDEEERAAESHEHRGRDLGDVRDTDGRGTSHVHRDARHHQHARRHGRWPAGKPPHSGARAARGALRAQPN